MTSLYIIGWDVGAWQCGTGDEGKMPRDGVCILQWNGISLEIINAPWRGNLFLPKGTPRDERGVAPIDVSFPQAFFDCIDAKYQPDTPWIVAADAVFGWPFLLDSQIHGRCDWIPRKGHTAISNRLLYRETERFIEAHYCPPLSALIQQIGSQATKVQWSIGRIRKQHPDVYVPPFSLWDLGIAQQAHRTVIEVYPSASKVVFDPAIDRLFPAERYSEAHEIRKTLALDTEDDRRDALICAVTGICYAKTVGMIGNQLARFPNVHVPSVITQPHYDLSAISQEGWIFPPVK